MRERGWGRRQGQNTLRWVITLQMCVEFLKAVLCRLSDRLTIRGTHFTCSH